MVDRPGGAEGMLAEYDAKAGLHESFRGTCENLVRQLLRIEGLRVHTVTSRVKERAHLAEKLSRFGKDYSTLSDVTDIIGVRVITHFEDDVDRIAEVIQREFEVDATRSIDKRKALDPDRFGYISLHFICSIRNERVGLAEYSEFAGLSCEIQVRSILQHAWAEIEHDLGYKVGAPIPAPIRRRFSRLAGLLEIADHEFTVIRDDLAQYAIQVPEEIRLSPALVGVDDISIKAFIENDSTSKYLDQEIAHYLGATLNDETLDAAEMIQFAGIQTIDELRRALDQRKDFILKQYKHRVEKGRYSTISHGVAIFHLFEVLIAEKGDPTELERAFQRFNISSEQGPAVAAKEVFDGIQAARSVE
jgi:putative GTP pyrophosphokinase